MSKYEVEVPMTEPDAARDSLSDGAGMWPRLSHWAGDISLRRITTSAKLIPQIDGLRFIAIVLVLVDHILNQGAPFMRTGGFLAAVDRRAIGFRAVYLFFTLSGFILALPFARQYLQAGRRVDVPSYFRRRLTRLEPPFIIAMLLRLIAFLAFSATSASTIFVHFLASIFYLHSAIFGPGSSINIPAWSLEIEVQFYIAAPLLAMLFRVRPAWLRRSIIIAAILAFSFASHLPALLLNQRLSFSLLCNLQYFLAGFLVCDLYVLRDFYRERSYSWDIAGIGCFLYVVWVANSWSGISGPLANIVICLAAFYGHMLPRFLSLAFVGIVGGMCYSIYLTHNSVITGVRALLIHIPGLTSHWLVFNTALFSLSFAAILFVGTLFFILIERPCMDPQWPSKAAAWFSARHSRQMSGQ